MMESSSNLYPDEDDISPQQHFNESHIRTGARVVHAHHDTSDQQQQQRRRRIATTSSNGNGGIRHSHGNGNPHIDIDMKDDESYYAKYGKRRLRTSGRWNNMTLIIFVSAISFVVGFWWMLSSFDSSSTSPKLRHTHNYDAPTAYNKAHGGHHHRQPRPVAEQSTQDEDDDFDLSNNENSLHLPSFDARKFLQSWTQRTNNAVAMQIQQRHPQTINLEGWNTPAGFRQFPYAKQTHGPIEKVDADFGGIQYESIKNKSKFERVIVIELDKWNNPIPIGGFDPNSVYPTASLKRRNKQRKKDKMSYPIGRMGDFDLVGENGASFEELRNYYDDDHVHLEQKGNDGVTRQPRACHSAEWSTMYLPTCNAFHEIDMGRIYDDPKEYITPRPENSMIKITYLNHGFYRDVWWMEESPAIWPEEYPKEKHNFPTETLGVEDEEEARERVVKSYRSAVLKTFRWGQDMGDTENWEMIQAEALIMERLTKSPRIMNIYGHCGFSVSAEVVPIEFEEVAVPGEGYQSIEEVEERNKDGIRPYNNFTSDQKLGFALEMAESLADLHGFKDGVIVHDDVQMCQWLRKPDGTMKLGDFNRATIMQYDVENEQYCKFNNGNAFGNYRSPEEYAVKNLDEQIDVYSFGNNIYALLTGLWDFYDVNDDGKVQKVLIEGSLPYVDPRYKERSFAERKLVELMEQCWKYDPAERINIFDAVAFLRKAMKENNELQR